MRLFTRGLAILVLIFGCVGTSQGTATRIMPLGDSITSASVGHASYRYWLWHDLLDGGFEADFVGSLVGVAGGEPLYPDFDQDHEGHWGWTADQILAQIGGWAATHQPQIVMVHLGTNDLHLYQGIASTLAELGLIVEELRAANPTVCVLLAQIIPGNQAGLDSIPEFNAQIPALAAALHTAESPVLVVDQFTGFDPYLDTYDGVHPNESGELKMSARWFERLSQILPDPAAVEGGQAKEGSALWLSVPRPTPSSDEVRITFDLQRAEHVRLGVYDVTGKTVTILADRPMGPGPHSLTWNGCRAGGERVAAGVYYANLSAGGSVRRAKLLWVHGW